MAKSRSLPPRYFEEIFASDQDPWNLASSPYEAEKHAETVAVLGQRRYDDGLEVGCAGGVLTRRLAPRCSRLLAIDVSASALLQARRRCADLENVSFAEGDFPKWAGGPHSFDLIVLSEVAYYWDDDDLAAAATAIRGRWAPGGRLVLVHWTGETDYPQTADEATDGLLRALSDIVVVERAERRSGYRLDLWRRG